LPGQQQLDSHGCGSKGFELIILQLNIQGISSKLLELEEVLVNNKVSIACICEHWLNQPEIEIAVPQGYCLGNSFVRSLHIRGGVSIYVAEGISFTKLDLNSFCQEQDFEVTGVMFAQLNLIVVSLYRSPVGKVDIFLQAMENLLLFLIVFKCKIIIAGDVNSDFDILTNKPSVCEFENLLRQFGMFCTNKEPTRMKACLDNVITNMAETDYEVYVKKQNLSDHDPIYFKVKSVLNTSQPTFTKYKVRRITDVRINHFKYVLSQQNWMGLLDFDGSASEKFEAFWELYLQLFEECFPEVEVVRKTRGNGRKNTNWYSPQLQNMKEHISFLSDIYRESGNVLLLNKLKSLKNMYRKELKAAKKLHNEEVIEKSSNKCKAAWTLINQAAGKNQHSSETCIDPDTFNDFCRTSVQEISNMVEASVEGAMDYMKKFNLPSGCPKFSLSPVTESEVRKVVNDMKSSSTKDVYGLSSLLVKRTIEDIISPLTYCLNLCLMNGEFPTSLKFSRVVPIFKKGARDEAKSFRPISCIPVMAKILEKILKTQVCTFFESNNLFNECQFGYRCGKSTTMAVDSIVYELLNNLEDGCFAQVTLCDLSKAFDCVRHDILIEKLKFYGFQGNALAMFQSYLKDRTQIVDVKGRCSNILVTNVGVPQGSVMGPILFIILVNDLSFNIDCKTTIYADDTSLLVNNKNFVNLENVAVTVFNDVDCWFTANGLFLNSNKTQRLLVSLRKVDQNHEFVYDYENVVSLLGIKLDSKLSWSEHIDYVSKKLSRVVYLLINLKRHVSNKYLKMAYFAFFESIIRYGLRIWGNGVGIQKILVIQKKVVRILTDSDRLAHCRPLFISSGILTIINLYILELLMYMKNNQEMFSMRKHVHDHCTRFNYKLNQPRFRLTKSMRYHNSISFKLFNKLPLTFQTLPNNVFYNKLYAWLQCNPFYKLEEYFDAVIK
jgi:hypothetical protein